ncbi:MAG: hypothetical protein ACLPN2_11550 [Terriglobales bacterium]
MKTKVRGAQLSSEATENRAIGRQLFGQLSDSYAPNRAIRIYSLILLVVCVGCGSGGGYNPNNVTVSVSPATSTISVNGQVALQATVNGECPGCSPLVNWSVTEDLGANCTWVDTPPTGPCPAGTVQVTEFVGSLTATYFVPGEAGTFHIVAYDVVSPTVSKQGTSAVTVSP